eukprot:593763-Pyramimonas_sp.AAC.1
MDIHRDSPGADSVVAAPVEPPAQDDPAAAQDTREDDRAVQVDENTDTMEITDPPEIFAN